MWLHFQQLIALYALSHIRIGSHSGICEFQIGGQILQEELCTYLHVTQGHLSKTEHGKTAPILEMLIRLSDRFHKSVDWILRGEGH